MTQIRGQRKQEGTSSSFGLHSPVFVMFMYNNNNNTLKAQSLDYPYSSSLGSWVTKSRRTGLCCITVWHIRDSQMLKISKHFQDFRGHCDWSQLSVSVTWIYFYQMEKAICSNFPKGIWQDSELTVQRKKKRKDYNDNSDNLWQI